MVAFRYRTAPERYDAGMNLASQLVAPFLAAAALAAPSLAQTIFVDANLTTGANNGSSWTDAYQGPLGLQAALAAAAPNQNIFVADGVYHPAAPGGARTASFTLKASVKVYGGFSGTETHPMERPALDGTASVLSGDLNGDDDASGQGTLENSYHVVSSGDSNFLSTLDGFTITAGNANGDAAAGHHVGGGLLALAGQPTIRDCVFAKNQSALAGGGAYSSGASCRFRRCIFDGNDGGTLGGAISLRTGNGLIVGCTFMRNRALRGGAMEILGSIQPLILHSLFYENEAGVFGGGAIWMGSASTPIINGCTIAFNRSTSTEGSGILATSSNPSIRGVILWGNEGAGGSQGESDQVIVSSGHVRYSIVQNTTSTSSGLSGADPQFADPAGGNFQLMPGSPAIDAAQNTTYTQYDLDANGQRRFIDDPATLDTGLFSAPISDMGAFEFQAGQLGVVSCDPFIVSPGTAQASGSASVATNQFMLTASELQPNLPGFFIVSRSLGFIANPGGSNGNVCLGGAIGRIIGPGQVANSGPSGSFTITLDLAAIPQPQGPVPALPGDTWSFQAWHRESGGGGSDFTDVTTVTFE